MTAKAAVPRAAPGARHIECQTNDLPLSSLLFEFSRDISANVALFEDHAVIGHVIPAPWFVPGAWKHPAGRSTRKTRSA